MYMHFKSDFFSFCLYQVVYFFFETMFILMVLSLEVQICLELKGDATKGHGQFDCVDSYNVNACHTGKMH
jgi:hypothetical protein